MQTICNKIFHLGECPLWSPVEKSLYWTDILNGEIWKYNESEGTSELYWKGDLMVGGFALSSDGSMILCSDSGIFRLRREVPGLTGIKPELIHEIPFRKGERFNDITTDPKGRIFAGTKDASLKEGKLWRIEKGMTPEVILDRIGISNGMTFSIDQQYLFHTDSQACTITRYKYDLTNGTISGGEIFYRGEPSAGFPDGITLDSQGNLWVAFWGGSCIRCLAPDGRISRVITLPARQPSSLNIGGSSMNTLYITSACEGGTDLAAGKDEEGNFLGGPVYSVKLNTRGRPEWLADI